MCADMVPFIMDPHFVAVTTAPTKHANAPIANIAPTANKNVDIDAANIKQ